MKKLSINKQYITVIFLALALSLMGFCIWFLFASIMNTSQHLITIKNSALSLEVQNREIEKFKKAYDVYKPNLEKMDNLFIDPQNPVDVIAFLETTADNSGIKAKISLQPTADQKTAAQMTLQLSANENFLKILRFSEALENGPHLLSIESINITNSPVGPNDKTSVPGKVNATFLIKAFAKSTAMPTP